MAAETLLASAILLLGLDQVTKRLVLSRVGGGQALSFGRVRVRPVISSRPILGFVLGRKTLLTLWVAEFAVVLALVHGPLFQQVVATVGLGMAFGGASGNLFDRLCRDGIVDFVDLGFCPVFNLADAAIAVGAILAVLFMR